MSDSFVDLSYRGLALGKRIKLTQVRAATGYLEMPAPMPVGTQIGIATDEGVLLEAQVAEIHEQVAGSEKPPGMVVRPKLDADSARTWWTAHIVEEPAAAKAPPAPDADGKVVVNPPRMSGQHGVPELVDDGRNTAVMEAVDDSLDPRDTNPSLPVSRTTDPAMQVPIADDGKRTVSMDAVDLAALGLEAPGNTGQMAAVKPDEADDEGGNGDKPAEGKSTKKKRKKR